MARSGQTLHAAASCQRREVTAIAAWHVCCSIGATMKTITTHDGVEIFYKDWGTGQPIVFSHGWPLSSDDWDAQMLFFLERGYRVIAHDRRGHGRSTQTGDGH